MVATFRFIGDTPPEYHADRVIAEMLRELAKKRALIAPAIAEVRRRSRDGGPRAQQRMAERIRRAGAMHVHLKPGTRGRYEMNLIEMTGWNPATNREIGVGDPIPERPWVACWLTIISNRGRSMTSVPALFMTHHAVSRAAQRFGLRTPEHVVISTMNIWLTLLDEFEALGAERFFAPPPQGRRVQIDNGAAIVIQRHRSREALVVVTIVLSDDGPHTGAVSPNAKREE